VIVGLVNRLLGAVGLHLSRQIPSGWSSDHLRRFGLAPSTLIDVGVGTGTPALYEAFPDARLILVEPLAEFAPHLDRILAGRPGRAFQSAVGSSEGQRRIRVESGNRLKSSFLERTALTATGEVGEEREISVTTLDHLLDAYESEFSAPIGLKIDTEGFELEVIEGATRLLERTLFVIAEVSVAARFEGGYSFADLVCALDQRGFAAVDLLDVSRSRRGPGARYVDVLFVRAPGTGMPS
jgi:FkbM family methyltransferase